MSEVQVGMQPQATKPFWKTGVYAKRGAPEVTVFAWRVPAIEPGDPFHTEPPPWIADALREGTITPEPEPCSDYLQFRFPLSSALPNVALADGWIVRNAAGTLRPMTRDEFEKVYEPA